MAAPGAQQGAVEFEALVVPHRSLSRRGIRLLLAAVLLASAVSGGVFVSIGAWPVGLFTGVELALAAFLVRLHLRAARASELLMLAGDGLTVVRTAPDGTATSLRLAADWLQVRLVERPGRVPALMLERGGLSEEVGRDLGEAAKRDLARALAAALHRRRHPVFDNPQLG